MQQFHPNFFDSEQMLRPYRTTEYGLPENKPSGNPFLYTAYLLKLMEKTNSGSYGWGELYQNMINKKFKTKESISHDEMTGLCCSKLDFEIWYSRCWYRPEVFLYWYGNQKVSGYLYILSTILLPILFLKMIITCAIKEKAENGLPETDGPLQAWLICESFRFKRVGKICMWLNKKHFGEYPLSEMFTMAFNRDADHPCRLLAMKLEGVM